MAGALFHYTDKEGYNAIRASSDWIFKASKPPGGNPFGAYFTDLKPELVQALKRLRIPYEKREYCFSFIDSEDLKKLRGRRGKYILFSPNDYAVKDSRKLYSGLSHEWKV